MRFRRCAALFAAIMLVAVVSGHGQAVMYKSYVFDAWGTAVPTPEPYMPVKTVYGNDLGIGNFRNAQDLFVAPDGTLYIVDTGNNRIVATDADFNVLAVHDRFEFAGETHTFKNPKGVFVTDDGQMFVADTLNLRVVHFDSQGNCVGIISDPEKDNTELFPDYFRFRPNKIAVDQAGRMYVTVEGLYEGIMVLDLDGRFRGFVGAPKVRIGFWDYFWRRIASDEQRKRMRHLLPTEYSSMYLDQQGFILTIVSGGDVNVDQLIRRLSPAGVDVLRRDGLHPPMGDLYTGYRSQISGYSQLVDIIGRDNDVYSVLDQRRGRVFTYDRDGNLLYVFGGTGQGEGLFVNPAALEELGSGNMVVLDASNNSITVFAPTEYAVMIHAALDHYEHGRYDQAAEMWQQVIRLNANYELAYSGVAAAGVGNIALKYNGWLKGGVSHEYPLKASMEKTVGSAAQLRQLGQYMEQQGYALYPSVSLVNVYRDSMFDGFNPKKDASRLLNRLEAKVFDYRLDVFDRIMDEYHYVLSPRKVKGLVDSFLANYIGKYDLDTLSIVDMGRDLNSDFSDDPRRVIDREESLSITLAELENMKKLGMKLLLDGGNSYAIPYAAALVNVPDRSSRFTITNQEVPFYQMVIHGLVSYAGQPVNLAADKQATFLKLLETGGSPYFILTGSQSFELKDTAYNEYFSSYYRDWLEYAAAVYEQANAVLADVQDQFIVEHRVLADRVYQTVYESGKSVIVNYDKEAVAVAGHVIEGEGYLVVEETVYDN